MTHPTDDDLDALVRTLCTYGIMDRSGDTPEIEDMRVAMLAGSNAITTLRAQIAEFEEMLDAAEKSNRISDNGNMWRFWADKARKIAVRLDEANARADLAAFEKEGK